MPADITGTEILEEEERDRAQDGFRADPFANMILADEINHSPKDYGSLAEAMQEHQVTALPIA
jgi:MoxR-like ATPase